MGDKTSADKNVDTTQDIGYTGMFFLNTSSPPQTLELFLVRCKALFCLTSPLHSASKMGETSVKTPFRFASSKPKPRKEAGLSSD